MFLISSGLHSTAINHLFSPIYYGNIEALSLI